MWKNRRHPVVNLSLQSAAGKHLREFPTPIKFAIHGSADNSQSPINMIL
jgi:hypothetical protein